MSVLPEEDDTYMEPVRARRPAPGRPAPQAPSTQKSPNRRPIPAPSMRGLADGDDAGRGGGGTRSSPWSDQEGGALATGVLDELGEEATMLGMKIPTQPDIEEVGFRGETVTNPGGEVDTDEDVFGDETVVSPVVTQRPKPAGRTARAEPSGEPWREVADAAAGPAGRRFERDPEMPTNVPLTDRKPTKRQQTDAALDELRSWAERRRRSRSTTGTDDLGAQPSAPVEELPSFRPPPKIPTDPTSPHGGGPTMRLTSPTPEPAKPTKRDPRLDGIEQIRSARPAPVPSHETPEPPSNHGAQLPAIPAPLRSRPPVAKPPTAESLAGRSPTTVPPLRRPRGETRSLAVDREDIGAAVTPQPLDDEPSAEQTKLGQLAQPDDDLLVAMPVMHEPGKEKSAPQPSETIAAPGELAGMAQNAEARSLSGLVKDLDTPPAEAPMVMRTQSEVRRGLAGHLAPSKPPRIRQINPETTSPEGNARPLFEDLSDGIGDTRPVFGQEETGAFLEALDPMPQALDPSLLDVQLLGRAETGAMPGTGESPAATRELRLATGARRIGSAMIDAIIIMALVAVPSLLGVFGDAIVNASIIDPDDVAALLVNGDVTLPIVAGVVLCFVYSALAHTFGGRTLGKLALGLELVRTKTGERPSVLRSFARSLLALLGLALGGLGYFWLILDRRGRALHDHLSATTVIVSSSR